MAECVCELREEEEEPRSHTLWSVKSERDPPSRRGIDFGKKRKKKRSFPCEKVRTGSEPEEQVPSEWPNVRRQTRYVEEGGKVREIWSQLFYFQLRFVVVLI